VEEDEVQAIADFRGETLEEVTAMYTHLVNGDRSLRDKPNTDCIFYDASAGCTVYAARPRQCRTWPFWESTTSTSAAWERTQKICPGAGKGELIPPEEITRRIKVIKL
jgi:Fe-S-cluster containining protein